ncbi:TfoX/Sxy family protein [Leptospira ilyithenensis]|uniref:TfoX/Sxy family protein n=1 Tax=Leptospira ilyithenensis TaxID=2484901 RepID=UPI001AEF8A85|nr:TfoX/Sxy family protein [Leptospira ilyithenensis]
MFDKRDYVDQYLSVKTIMSNPFVEETLEKLSILGNVTARAMFGGHGLYLDGVMFGLVAEDVLYLKVDDQTISKFQAAGGRPFTYDGKEGAPAVMSYWTFPSEVWESPEDLKEWGEIAYQAAVRSKPEAAAPKPEPVAKTVSPAPQAKKSAPKKKATKKKAKPAKKKAKVKVAKKKAKAKKSKPTPKKSKKAVKKSSKKLVSKKKSIKKKPVKKAKAKKAAKKKKRSK